MHQKRAHWQGGPSGFQVAVLVWLVAGLAGSAGAAFVIASGRLSFTPSDLIILSISVTMVLSSLIRLTFGSMTPTVREVARKSDHLLELHATLKSLAKAAEHRDNLTTGHCQRVAFNAERLAECMGLTDRERDEIRWAALLHDIGKAAVPQHVLLKPGELTDEEFIEVKKHSQTGADLIMSASPELAVIATLVLSHHERWDGKGYPRALSGTDIPLGARIIAVADVFEALTSERPYRTKLSHGDALATIAAGSGTHFDPDVVAVFGRLTERDSPNSLENLSVGPPSASTRFKFTSYESISTLLMPITR